MDDKSVARRAAEVVERSQHTLARGDIDEYLTCFAQDAVVHDPAIPPMVGHAGLRQGIESFVQMFAKAEFLELKLFPVGRTVALKATLRFVTRNGKEGILESVDVFELNEDFKIYKGTAYWDPEPFMKLLQE
ncbi:nuclear transport factor 2 family protein [Hyalangium sp.]|uniref:nuclear transport factor 2 family protein n=1 Tax=Hyalangium sp. TaxID=2028555 RepID=UPI002D307E8E|nr:nuclear transport factor 2 family protein [Hyalangium sp.]HYH96865.1 nuclear transport factor 2 family protein [Hyalangium sp.]